MHGHAAVEEQRFVGSPKIVQPKCRQAERTSLFLKCLGDPVGSRSFVNEKLWPGAGGEGDIKAPSGNRTNERSTDASSGTPAAMRKSFSRSVQSKAKRSSSIASVRL
jgi:hypothetical protein